MSTLAILFICISCLIFRFPDWLVNTKWNVSQSGYNNWCDDNREATEGISFDDNILTLVGAYKSDYRKSNSGRVSKMALTEINVQRERCSQNCGNFGANLDLLVGKVYSKLIRCQPALHCLRVTRMADGLTHFALYCKIIIWNCLNMDV